MVGASAVTSIKAFFHQLGRYVSIFCLASNNHVVGKGRAPVAAKAAWIAKDVIAHPSGCKNVEARSALAKPAKPNCRVIPIHVRNTPQWSALGFASGFTLPGMIDDLARSRAGSIRPTERGPEAQQTPMCHWRS